MSTVSRHPFWIVVLALGLFCLGMQTGLADDVRDRQPAHPYYGNGEDRDLYVSHGDTVQLTRDYQFENVTIEVGGTLDTQGYVVKVRGTLINSGAITDTRSGGDGGAGGSGGRGSDPLGPGPDNGEDGDDGGWGELGTPSDKAGRGGRGGGGGGGGGGVKWELLTSEADANGGDGGDGAIGGNGGGYIRIYAFQLDNQSSGLIHANGENGVGGEEGGDGEYYAFGVPLKDIAGGGGGGGGGGAGGDGGTVEIYYAFLLSHGQIEANGGAGGAGGSGGIGGEYGGSNKKLDYGVLTGWTLYPPGGGGDPNGGDGGNGEYRKGYHAEDGDGGTAGAGGQPGDVFLTQWPVPPIPDIKVNGLDDDFTAVHTQKLVVTVSVDPGDCTGDLFEVWIWVENLGNSKKWSWIWPGQWVSGWYAARNWQVQNVNNRKVFEGKIPAGEWLFNFALNAPDGIYQEWYRDDIKVKLL